MDFLLSVLLISCMIALACIAHVQDELNEINNKLFNMKLMVNAYSERTERILDLAQSVLNDNDKMIKYIDALEGRIKKESTDSEVI